ncbi:hypothetical protein ACH4PR_44695 [Streptomyces mirabilis]|uniref:hypothetical protein n=1 Tax=Streptomyces mirabilis TaxID=68239 RepID=UPI00379F2A7C
MRTVRVLPAGAAPTSRVTESVPTAAAMSEAPVKTREMASPGFHQALAAHRAVMPGRRVDPGIAEAPERQTRAMRELSARAFPETGSDDQTAPIEVARLQRRREADAARAAALRRARAERAGREAGTVAAVPGSAALRSTA